MTPVDVGCLTGSIWKLKGSTNSDILSKAIVIDVIFGFNSYTIQDTYDILYKFTDGLTSRIYTRSLKSFLHYFELISNYKEYIL
jgi:hypothetical protein